MTIREFVENLFYSAIDTPTKMSVEDAAADLENFSVEDWDVPEDVTAEEYSRVWNELVEENADKE